ncbi:hypothetical protein BH09ACT1_BH09ACT1_06080 [soil metagenome]
MDIRIGIINSPREISFETSQSAAEIEKVVSDALDSTSKYFKLTDSRGGSYIVPVESFGYLELGSEDTRRVGFVA